MTSNHSTNTTHPRNPGSLFRCCATALLSLTLAQFMAGCHSLQSVAHSQGATAQGWWVELDSSPIMSVAPGVELHLPQSPYRPSFTDSNGIYFKASLPLIYRTTQGVQNGVQGGLYVRNDNPDIANVWVFPELGALPAPHTRPIKIKLHKPN